MRRRSTTHPDASRAPPSPGPDVSLAGVLGALLGGWAATSLALRRPPARLLSEPHLRTNHRGLEIPGTLGILLLWGLAFGGASGLALGWSRGGGAARVLAVVGAGTAMGLLGLLDDVRRESRGGGFLGHLRALRSGHVTTGLVKAGGGGAVGLAAAWTLGRDGPLVLAGGAVVALAANLANLFDLRPGRALKVWLVAFGGLLAARPEAPQLAVVAGLAGAVLAFLPSDLRERGMLGDTGANLAGAALGVVAVATLSPVGLLVLLGVLVLLTGASEMVSFDRVIRRVGPLRAIDRAGRLPEKPSPP